MPWKVTVSTGETVVYDTLFNAQNARLVAKKLGHTARIDYVPTLSEESNYALHQRLKNEGSKSECPPTSTPIISSVFQTQQLREHAERLHPEIESENIRVCNWLKQKIAEETKESGEYRHLEKVAQDLTGGHIFLDGLFQAQDIEIAQLKELYKNLYCSEV